MRETGRAGSVVSDGLKIAVSGRSRWRGSGMAQPHPSERGTSGLIMAEKGRLPRGIEIERSL